MVYQAHARWSRERIDAPPERWMSEILEEAGRLAGPWAAHPAWTQAHRWRYARIDRGSELSGPLLAALPGGARVGLAGELFAPGGGIEVAWQSGRRLARMLMQEERS